MYDRRLFVAESTGFGRDKRIDLSETVSLAVFELVQLKLESLLAFLLTYR